MEWNIWRWKKYKFTGVIFCNSIYSAVKDFAAVSNSHFSCIYQWQIQHQLTSHTIHTHVSTTLYCKLQCNKCQCTAKVIWIFITMTSGIYFGGFSLSFSVCVHITWVFFLLCQSVSDSSFIIFRDLNFCTIYIKNVIALALSHIFINFSH